MPLDREAEAMEEVGKTSVARPAASALIALFLASLLVVPLVQQVRDLLLRKGEEGTRVPQSWEVVRLLPSPRAIASVRGAGDLLGLITPSEEIRAFEHTLEERSWLRRRVLSRAASVLLALGAGNEQAYPGRDGWLFYRPCVEYLTGTPFLEPKRPPPPTTDFGRPGEDVAADPLPAILDLKQKLAARGTALVLLVAPAKPTVHPEALAGKHPERPLQNPSFARFRAELESAGIPLLDPAPELVRAKRSTGESQYLRADSHWKPQAMEEAAASLAALVRARVPLPASAQPPQTREAARVAAVGDTAALLGLAEPAQRFALEEVTVHRVLGPSGEAWRPDREADVLLLGDSFTNVYSQRELGWGEGAGLAEQLSFALGRPVDRIAINAGGAYAARLELARDPSRLAGKKVVVWELAARELSAGDWRLVELGAPGSSPLAAPAPATGMVVRATVAEHAGTPEPATVPYRDCFSALRLTAVETVGGPALGKDVLAFVWTMRDGAWTDAARIARGTRLELALRPWAERESEWGSFNRIELSGDALLLDAYWGEDVRRLQP